MFFYIHGFAADGLRSTIALTNSLSQHVGRLFWLSEKSFELNLKSLLDQLKQFNSNEPMVLIGSSMGGFYASIISSILKVPCVLFNPVTDPKKSLIQFQGKNTYFSTGKEFELTKDVIDSYIFDDPRKINVKRIVILGNKDQIVDHVESNLYWQNNAEIHIVDLEHQVSDYSPFVSLIQSII